MAQDLAVESDCIKMSKDLQILYTSKWTIGLSLLRPVDYSSQNLTMPESYQAKRIKQVSEMPLKQIKPGSARRKSNHSENIL